MLLTVDIGTSNYKSALWDYEGNRLAFAAFSLSVDVRDRAIQETRCDQWLRAFEDCCRSMAKDAHVNLCAVEAVIISGNGPTLVPVLGEPSAGNDGLAVPAENARGWLDRRAEKYQEKVSRIMGGFVDAGFFLPKALSIKNDEPEVYDRVKHFLGCPEYLSYALTGEARTVFPADGFDRWFWNDSVLRKLELDAQKFPPFIRPGEAFGTISKQAAKYFGFADNVPVISGGPDFFTAILGAGVTKPGLALDRTGSSEGINLCTKKPVSAGEGMRCYGHPVKPYWNLFAGISFSGLAIEREKKSLGLSCIDDFFDLARNDPASEKGARANQVLKGICFAVKDIIRAMEEACALLPQGERAEQLRVSGGLASNDFFNQMKADITGREIHCPVYKEAELLGGAVIGACYFGRYSSFAESAGEFVKIEKSYEPKTHI